jgi:glycosyltransferase involved in cell wall biosynthesis
MLEPIFSIILPVYNRPEYLAKVIETVISQTYSNWELIIADDNSNIETKEILRKYEHSQIRLISNSQNLGLFPNLNQAMGKCENNFILLLCSDDFLLVDGLEKLANRIKLNPGIDFFLTAFEMVDGEDNSISSGSQVYFQSFMQQAEQVLSSCESLPLLLKLGSVNGNLTGMCFSRNLIKRIGGFRYIELVQPQRLIFLPRRSLAFVSMKGNCRVKISKILVTH